MKIHKALLVLGGESNSVAKKTLLDALVFYLQGFALRQSTSGLSKVDFDFSIRDFDKCPFSDFSVRIAKKTCHQAGGTKRGGLGHVPGVIPAKNATRGLIHRCFICQKLKQRKN